MLNTAFQLLTSSLSVFVSIQPILISRFMFNLRDVYQSGNARGTSSSSSAYQLSSAHFATNVIGNFGAPLTLGDPGLTNGSQDEPPAPVVCDDPFMVGLVKEDAVELRCQMASDYSIRVLSTNSFCRVISDVVLRDADKLVDNKDRRPEVLHVV